MGFQPVVAGILQAFGNEGSPAGMPATAGRKPALPLLVLLVGVVASRLIAAELRRDYELVTDCSSVFPKQDESLITRLVTVVVAAILLRQDRALMLLPLGP
jgi:hypothetical protein